METRRLGVGKLVNGVPKDKGTHLFPFDISVSNPLAQTWPPILEEIRLCILNAETVPEATLRGGSRD